MGSPLRIKATDDVLVNVAYIIRNSDGSYRCALANGTPASFSYAGIQPNKEMECKFALMDAGNDHQAILKAQCDAPAGAAYPTPLVKARAQLAHQVSGHLKRIGL